AVVEATVTGWVLGADRVTVKVAEAVPVFPSMTVRSLIRSAGGGGGGGVQLPSLRRTEAVFEPALAVATSGRPSPLKSPTAIADGDEPTAYAPANVSVPFPLPSSSLAVPVSASDVTASRLPSPWESAAAARVGWERLAEGALGSPNVPSPRPVKISTAPPETTRSGMPSPVKSPTATARNGNQ